MSQITPHGIGKVVHISLWMERFKKVRARVPLHDFNTSSHASRRWTTLVMGRDRATRSVPLAIKAIKFFICPGSVCCHLLAACLYLEKNV
jgi:hypothetical protein